MYAHKPYSYRFPNSLQPIGERGALIIALCLFFIVRLDAQENKAPDRWTPKDIINTKYARSLSFSDDGQMIVWSQQKSVEKEDKFVSDIYLTRLNKKKAGKFRTFQLTQGKTNEYNALFSKDNETIYFLSSREKGKKLWALSLLGGEAKEIHTFENGISNMQWLDNENIIFVGNDGKTYYEQQAEKIKDNTITVEDSLHWKISKIYRFNIKEKTIKRLTNNQFPVSSYRVSKDGKYMVTSHLMSRHYASDSKPANKHYLHNILTNTNREILKGLQSPGSFEFTNNHQGFYFIATHSSDPEWAGAGIQELYYYNLEIKAYSKLDLNWQNGIGRGFYTAGDQVIVSLADGATRQIAAYSNVNNQWKKQVLDFGPKNGHVNILNVSKQGNKIAFLHSTAAQLPKYYLADINVRKGKVQLVNTSELLTLNANLKQKTLTKSEVFKWIGGNNEEVNGILYYPENYESGKKYPLILSIHGGPAGADLDMWSERWSAYPNLYAQKGAFVLKPNYHGSSNHGLAFVESIKKNYYELEMTDIINGIEALNKRGMIDMDKLGVMGWSNGAILTTMLTLRFPDMFKAAAPGAGDVNWTSDFGTCSFGVRFDQSYFGGAPWDDTNGKNYNENYILKSPLFDIEKIITPTIIFHGSEDRAVPRDQGWEYYRGLQQVGKAPVRFLWFPGQPHGLRKLTHQLRKMKEEIAWFDQYLFNNYAPENESFKKDSPLALALEKDKAKKHNGHYGRFEQSVLLPEMAVVKKDSIAISKFEITNAQYQSFKTDHNFATGLGNYPVRGLSKEEISAYVGWLQQLSGKAYRLPNKKEAMAMQKHAKKVGPKENTLNYWAGYAIAKDDFARFKEKITGVKSSLIKEVGSYKAIELGGANIYDVGGNVAEYFIDNDNLKTYGYSAYDFVDPADPTPATDPANTGFRVILVE